MKFKIQDYILIAKNERRDFVLFIFILLYELFLLFEVFKIEKSHYVLEVDYVLIYECG